MKIDLYHIDAMEAPHYTPLWRELCRMGVEARLVCVPGNENTAADGWFDFDRTAQAYRERGIPFDTRADPEAHTVTTQNGEILARHRGLHVRLMYGAVVFPLAWGLNEISVTPFDLILAHGPMYTEHFAQWKDPERLLLAGFARYDDSFAGRVETDSLQRELGIDGKRPVLVYFPTWEHNSSLDRFLDSVSELQRDFDVVIKPHHCTIRMEPERMQRIRASGARLAEGTGDLEMLFALADVVLADARSGAFTESILLGRPTVGLVADPAELDLWLRPVGADLLADLCTEPAALAGLVTRNVQDAPSFPARPAWCNRAVSFRDGTAARHAASSLIDALERFEKDSG